MTDRKHPAGGTAVLELIGLHSQDQPLLVVDLNIDYMHARNVEHRIGPGAPARTGTTPRVGHRRGFRLGSLVASDHEGPDTLNP
jgi:hypothetical protein